jgi:3,4-dihydroxy-2-butanone 4-phosphate synthase
MLRGRCDPEPAVTVRDPPAAGRRWTRWNAETDGARAEDFGRPGHIFPLRSVPGGVLEREGHTEAGTDLSLLCGLSGVTALCEIVRPDWSMARYADLERLAEKEELPMLSVAHLVRYRREHAREL